MTTTINASTVSGLVNSADTSGILQLQTASTAALTIDASQNVGIGTASPTSSSVLDVVSGGNTFPRVRSSIGSSAALFFQNSDTGTTTSDGMYVGITGSEEGVIWNNENTDLRIATNNTEQMRITSTGILIVGASSTAANSRTVSVNNSSQDNFALITQSSQWGFNHWHSNVGTQFYQAFRYGNVASSSLIGSIQGNNTNITYSTSSDYRLKENITPMTGALNAISALNPVTWKWKSTGEDGQGFIAHELAEVVPDCVIGAKDAVDDDGNPVYQGIDTSYLVATLTAALQETKALLDTQAETINALTARIVALESKGTV